ncbi:MAG TPA: hypothetical protein VM819_05170 [Vicinamibacterales bacterium]|jgi:hypothetical protein|nr:hypothetical protein [Vicinamibacterales bacterium]
MNFSRIACTAVLVLGVAPVVSAQSALPPREPVGTTGISAETPVPVSGIDVNRLPIDLQRIERRFRQGQIREERDGLNLRYYIDVFAVAPRIVLFTEQDNLRYGPVPYGGPTHNEMLEMMTPRPFRNHGGVNILSPNSKK